MTEDMEIEISIFCPFLGPALSAKARAAWRVAEKSLRRARPQAHGGLGHPQGPLPRTRRAGTHAPTPHGCVGQTVRTTRYIDTADACWAAR